MEAIPDFNCDIFTVQQDIGVGQMIQAGGTVTGDLILDKSMVSIAISLIY